MTLKCAKCGRYCCYIGELDKLPDFCPMKLDKDVYEDALIEYEKNELVKRIAMNSAWVEATGYLKWSRVEETIEFARRCGFKRLGLAFCIGLRNEARILEDVFEKNGFEVRSVVCKTGSIPKEKLGFKKIVQNRYEVMCNPIAQAMLLNREETELNIILGLCVGHDSLFIMYSRAPVTCLAVKDRVLAHNPLGAIYTSTHYYRKKLYENHKI